MEDFALAVDQRTEDERKEKYFELVRKPMKLWSMEVTVVMGVALRTFHKILGKITEKVEIK